jgi:hypothetical protein
VRQRILHLARTTYAGFNDHHLTEKMCEAEGIRIGRETLRQLLRAEGIGPPRKRRPPAHRQRRARRPREGEMLQVDASPHDWLEGRGPQITLLGFQDDASGKVVGAEFFPSETAYGYFRVFRGVLRRYGIPLSLYGDRCGVFVRNDNHWTVEEELAGRQHPTQFGRALEQLGVTFIPAYTPLEDTPGAFDAPLGLDRICCFIHERIVSNDNVVQWDGRRFQIPPQPRRFSFAGARVQLVQDLAGRVALYYGDTKLQLEALKQGGG